MSYFALLDSDTENETSNVKITVKKETKDTKSKLAASVPDKPADAKSGNDQKENKNASTASVNSKDKKPPKGIVDHDDLIRTTQTENLCN